MGLLSGLAKIGGAVFGGSNPIAGAALSAFGSFLDANSAEAAQRDANRTNQDIAAANNATSIELANTAYQRRVKDLSAAGLNPMLAYAQGGSQVPNLQAATVANTAVPRSQVELQSAQIANISAQTRAADSQAALNSAMASKTMVDAEVSRTQAGLNQLNLDVGSANKIARIWTNDKIMEADRGDAILRTLRSSNDWNTVNYLNDFAQKNGFRNFDEAMGSLLFRNKFQANLLQSYDIPKASALGDFYSTDFGKNIAPYLNSATQAGGVFSDVAGGLNYLKKGLVK